MTREAAAYAQFITSGAMEIRADGTIWRKQIIFFHGKEFRRDSIEPRRAETLNPATLYYRITTREKGRWLSVQAHRLVYFHFFGEISEGMVINHKNGIKLDNRPENLEAITQAANVIHMREVLGKGGRPPRNPHLRGERHPQARFTRNDVVEIRNELRLGKLVKVIAKERGVSISAVASINFGKSYRNVTEDRDITFPIQISKFHPYKTAAQALKAEEPKPYYDVGI